MTSPNKIFIHKIKIRLPEFVTPRLKWRKAIHDALLAECGPRLHIPKKIKLGLDIVLYLSQRELDFHDVDNRLKDIMDALQGKIGGPKKLHTHHKFIENDSQIFQVTIIKKLPPKQSKGLGHLVITTLKGI